MYPNPFFSGNGWIQKRVRKIGHLGNHADPHGEEDAMLLKKALSHNIPVMSIYYLPTSAGITKKLPKITKVTAPVVRATRRLDPSLF